MAKININNNSFNWIYKLGFFIILALPILVIPPYFEPPDWGKTIVFRSIMAILLFLFIFQFLFKKNEISLISLKNNKIAWALGALFIIFLLATIFSVDPNFSLWGSPYRGGGFVNFAFYFAFAILAFFLFKKEDWKKIWLFSIFIGVLVSLLAVIQYYGLFNRIFLAVPDRPPSTMGNPILLAIYLLLLLFPTLLFAVKEKNKHWKTFYIFAMALFLYAILITGSRAVYLGILIGALYFFLFYFKKIKYIKIAIAIFMILLAGVVFYINIASQYPKFLQENKLFQSIAPRLLMVNLTEDPRFAAWQIELNIMKSKPLLGYGPENFAVGFDKYYDSSIPYLDRDVGWYDKAHNIILQIGSEAGILGIIAYLALFAVLFWELNKIKNSDSHKYDIEAHVIQAVLIGYLVANFFSFDSFSTYLISFLLIGYSLHLIEQNSIQNKAQTKTENKKNIWKPAFIFALFCLLIIFIWQYNILPLQINAKINKATDLANQKQCDQAFSLMDKVLPKHTFLDSYIRMKYVESVKTCAGFYPEKNLAYMKKALELMNEAVKVQPLYTRYWIYMGEYTTALASQENNPDIKNNLLKQASDYFDKALQLSPKHQEILIGRLKTKLASGDYKNVQDYSEKCVALYPSLSSCYWYLALSQLYLKDTANADKNMQIAVSKGYDRGSQTSLNELSDVYNFLSDYQGLALVYEKLIAMNPNIAQYHSSLAFIYKELSQYDKARQEALKVLQLSPQSKQNVDAFLKTLPLR